MADGDTRRIPDTASADGRRPGPGEIDRLLVQQYDIARRLTIGGIGTCIRGILEYAPPGVTLGVIGMDDGSEAGHRLGRWSTYQRGGRTVHFLPVVRFDSTRPKRFLPHSARLVAGLIRYRSAIPAPKTVQAHRLDIAMVLRLLFRAPLIYSIHTQQHGLIGRTSDSFWRFAGGSLYERLDRATARRARRVIVFNPDYAETVRAWNPRTISAPTWFDPANTPFRAESVNPYAVLWVGRLQVPKDPELAVRAFAHLAADHPDEPWTLEIAGSGPLRPELERRVAALPPDVSRRISLLGRLDPVELAEVRARSAMVLMTSHPGYEGFPRVLVEALASGLPAVVTEGSDTGGLVRPGVSGSVHGRDPAALADGLRAARELDRTAVAEVVSALSAPEVVRRVFFEPDGLAEPAGSGR